MRVTDYLGIISETVNDLKVQLIKAHSWLCKRRLRFLISLKSGHYTTRKQAGAAIGLSPAGADKLWNKYSKEGLISLLCYPYNGKKSKLSDADKEKLLLHLNKDSTSSLHQCRKFIEEQTGIHYSLSAIHYICKGLKVKKKTGRPSNIRKDEKKTETFKKRPLQP